MIQDTVRLMRIRTKSVAIAGFAAAVTAVTVLLLVPLPATRLQLLRPALFAELEGIGHVLAFAILGMSGHRILSDFPGRRRNAGLAALAAGLILLAAATEMGQLPGSRDASLADFGADVLGIIIGLCWPVRRRTALPICLSAIAAGAPLAWTSCAYLTRAQASPLIWRSDSVLLDRFASHQGGRYPGLALTEVPPDWRRFDGLLVTVRNPGAVPTAFHLRVHDVEHNQDHGDRFNQEFRVDPAATATYRIPLKQLVRSPAGRRMDMRSISGVVVFQAQSRADPLIQVLAISLDTGDVRSSAHDLL